MSKKPILILQMQRMGDLILSYPLLLWLQKTYPGHPLFVAAEEAFYKPLMKLSPAATYFPWEGVNVLKQHSYEMVVNLSIQDKAARLAYDVEAERKVGPVQSPDGGRFVHGDWQLYRTSLVRNNLYNRFHWAELNALDVIPPDLVRSTRFDVPRNMPPDNTKVGLFLGASDPVKRPVAGLWAELIQHLLGRGLRPVLLGGPAEKELGQEVMKLAKAPALNLCGKLGLDELAAIGQTLSLLVTPDTGPMHLAAWTGLKTLNLSMGNVNPWETGPFAPGHFVLRADMDCANGCWSCWRDRLYCHDPIQAKPVAGLVARMVAGDTPKKLMKLRVPGARLFSTAKRQGLYHLDRLDDTAPDTERLLSRFWQTYFGNRFGIWGDAASATAWKDVAETSPEAAEQLLGHIPEMSRQFTHGLKKGELLNESFWADSPAAVRPLTGFIHMSLENGNFAPPAWARALELLEALIACCR